MTTKAPAPQPANGELDTSIPGHPMRWCAAKNGAPGHWEPADKAGKRRAARERKLFRGLTH